MKEKSDELYTKCCAKYELKNQEKKEKLLFYDIYSRNTSDLYVYHLHNLNSTIVYASELKEKFS